MKAITTQNGEMFVERDEQGRITYTKFCPKPPVQSINGELPHPDYGGWEGFLQTCKFGSCVNGVTHYYSSNCNYIVFPDGTLIENFGYHGQALMNRVDSEGADAVLAAIRKNHQEIKKLLCV
jgi:hypothetical protein